MQTSLLHRICFGAWMIDPSFVRSHAHIIDNIIHGRMPQDSNKKDVASSYILPKASSGTFNVRGAWSQDFPENTVAILPMHDPIFKQDQSCGPAGTLTMMNWLKNAANSSNVLAIVIDADCPGGEATNIETAANLVASIKTKKPVLTSFNGFNCSASLFITGASDKIFATESTDIIGSIGTMMSFLDVIPMLEAQGAKYHEIYADQSTNKNKVFSDALNGDYKGLKEQLLNPYAETFINKMKEFRPQITNQEVFKGGTYMAPEALKLGLIDGIQTLEQTVQLAYEMGMQRKQQNNSNNNSTNMANKYPKLNATLKIESLVVDEEKGAYMQADQLETIESTLTASETSINELTEAKNTLTTANATLTESVNTLTASEKKLVEENTALKAEVVKLGGTPPANPELKIGADKITAEEKEISVNDANHPLNKAMEAKYGIKITTGK